MAGVELQFITFEEIQANPQGMCCCVCGHEFEIGDAFVEIGIDAHPHSDVSMYHCEECGGE